MKEATKIIHFLPSEEGTGAICTPIYQTSTFEQSAPGVNKGFDYSRSNNPTRQALESLLAELEQGDGGFAFASGLAAVDAIVKLLSSGDEIVAVDDIYGGSFRLFTHLYEKLGIRVKYVDTTDVSNVADAIGPKTKLVWLESPTNPTLKVSDIKAIASIAHSFNALLVVDNTFASPYLQKPITLGADLVLHSATKYLAGHSDVIAGAVITATPELSEQIKFIQNSSGAVLGPFDSWLTIRGIQTLPLRIERQCENALAVARFLEAHEEVAQVFYPGLESHRNHQVAIGQQELFGGVVSFVLQHNTAEAASHLAQSTRLFKLAESLGGVKSLVCHPASMTHKSTPPETRRDAGIEDGLVRLSCGIENAEDLIADLEHALEQIKHQKFELVYA